MDLNTVMDPYEMPLSENRTFYFIQSPRKSPPPPPRRVEGCVMLVDREIILNYK
jgi:hypothetical protein